MAKVCLNMTVESIWLIILLLHLYSCYYFIQQILISMCYAKLVYRYKFCTYRVSSLIQLWWKKHRNVKQLSSYLYLVLEEMWRREMDVISDSTIFTPSPGEIVSLSVSQIIPWALTPTVRFLIVVFKPDLCIFCLFPSLSLTFTHMACHCYNSCYLKLILFTISKIFTDYFHPVFFYKMVQSLSQHFRLDLTYIVSL